MNKMAKKFPSKTNGNCLNRLDYIGSQRKRKSNDIYINENDTN